MEIERKRIRREQYNKSSNPCYSKPIACGGGAWLPIGGLFARCAMGRLVQNRYPDKNCHSALDAELLFNASNQADSGSIKYDEIKGIDRFRVKHGMTNKQFSSPPDGGARGGSSRRENNIPSPLGRAREGVELCLA